MFPLVFPMAKQNEVKEVCCRFGGRGVSDFAPQARPIGSRPLLAPQKLGGGEGPHGVCLELLEHELPDRAATLSP